MIQIYICLTPQSKVQINLWGWLLPLLIINIDYRPNSLSALLLYRASSFISHQRSVLSKANFTERETEEQKSWEAACPKEHSK